MMSTTVRPYMCARCSLGLQRTALRRPPRASRLNQRRTYTVKHVSQEGKPFRMAVIGSGPAGFYTAYKVLSRIDNAKVDMYEQLPVPYGLVRFGVAPDHPEVKNCQEKFEEVAESPNFQFIGNMPIGDEPGSLPLRTIASEYDAILFAYGASKDRELRIPGERDLRGIYSARAFVGWYNGLPEYADLNPDLFQGEEAIVIGQGNVALDCARILLADLNELRKTDITEVAVEALSRSRVKSVRVVGRRGPSQAAFTIKEVRELMKLPEVAFSAIEPSLFPPDLTKVPRPSRRILDLLQKGNPLPFDTAPKNWSLEFRLSPTSFNSNISVDGQLTSMSFERTELCPDAFDPSARANGTGESLDLTAQLAFRSIGYKSEALPGFSELGIPFDDDRGIIPNDKLGRVVSSNSKPNQPESHAPGMYCAGWVKRGPTGVIASTMADAFSTAEAIAEDWHSNTPFINSDGPRLGWENIKDEAQRRGCRRVSWQDWMLIDAAERKRGLVKGKEREKFTRIEDMLAILD